MKKKNNIGSLYHTVGGIGDYVCIFDKRLPEGQGV